MKGPDQLVTEAESTSLSIQSITDGFSSRDIPIVKFVEDINVFSNEFDPPASAELMIGAFSDLFSKLKGVESTLSERCKSCAAVIFFVSFTPSQYLYF
jgi:hypothetical protein